MAKLIQFYIPACYHQKVRWIPKQNRGKVIAFPIMKSRGAAIPGGPLDMKWRFLTRSSRSAK